MHEMSIAQELVRSVLAAAADHDAVEIHEVVLELGVMKMIVPEALELAWSAVTEGTPAAGSRLKTTEVPLKGRCRQCGRDFEPKIDDFLCPGCGQADVDITAGDEIILRSITCRTRQAASSGESPAEGAQ